MAVALGASPLDINTPLVDAVGRPTPVFIRQWEGIRRSAAMFGDELPWLAIIPKLNQTNGTASAAVNGGPLVASIRIVAKEGSAPTPTEVRAADPIDGQVFSSAAVGTLLTGLTAGDHVHFGAYAYTGAGATGEESALFKAEAVYGMGTSGFFDFSVTSDKISDGALDRAALFGAQVVEQAAIKLRAVGTSQLALAGVERENLIAKVVNAALLDDNILDLTQFSRVVLDNAIVATKLSVNELSEIVDDAGIIIHGELRNAAGTRYINLDATGAQPFIAHPNFEIRADGSAYFKGELVAASGSFTGTLTAAAGTLGLITAGVLQNAAGVNYIDLLATGAQPFIKCGGGIEMRANGTVLFAGTLSAPSGTLGTITAGSLVSPSGNVEINLLSADGWFIDVQDGSGNVKFRVGHNGDVTMAGILALESTLTAASRISYRTGGSEFGASYANDYSGGGRVRFELGGQVMLTLDKVYGGYAYIAADADIFMAAGTGVLWANWKFRQHPTFNNLDWDRFGVNMMWLDSVGGLHVADDYYTFSPVPPKPAAEMSAREWMEWGAEDARKPHKPYEGRPDEDSPFVKAEAARTKKSKASVAEAEIKKYRKNVSKMALGTARGLEGLHAAILAARDLDHLKELIRV
jgi:hypothetical protein